MATNNVNVIANTCGIFFLTNQLHKGFNKMESIKANAIGRSISLRWETA